MLLVCYLWCTNICALTSLISETDGSHSCSKISLSFWIIKAIEHYFLLVYFVFVNCCYLEKVSIFCPFWNPATVQPLYKYILFPKFGSGMHTSTDVHVKIVAKQRRKLLQKTCSNLGLCSAQWTLFFKQIMSYK